MAHDDQLAVLFPGQGSQAPDMRVQVERHRPDLLKLATAEVGVDLFERAGEGTRWAQPAIFCAALAGWERLMARLEVGALPRYAPDEDVARVRLEPGVLAGHSLGEIAALVAADALDAADGLRLVAARGRLMQEAAEQTGGGGMMAVRVSGRAPDAGDDAGRTAARPASEADDDAGRTATGRERAAIEQVADATGLALANDNAPDQLVLSGSLEALAAGEHELRERGVRAKRLPVAGAFHSPLMEPAVAPFRAVVEAVEIREPRIPVLSCVTAAPFTDVRAQLVASLTRPVRWTDVLHALRSRGVTRCVETGPGQVLTGLVRKTLKGVDAQSPLGMEAARA
jgi:malonyl CoA-acyl carrier protein transacylase